MITLEDARRAEDIKSIITEYPYLFYQLVLGENILNDFDTPEVRYNGVKVSNREPFSCKWLIYSDSIRSYYNVENVNTSSLYELFRSIDQFLNFSYGASVSGMFCTSEEFEEQCYKYNLMCALL